MPKQASIFPMTGTMAGFSFYHNKDHGYLVRRKGGPKPEKMQERSLENARELGRASKTGKLIRHAVREGLRLQGDSTVTQRLTKLLVSILQADTISLHGKRNVANGLAIGGNRQRLEGFAFDEHTPPDRVLHKRVVFVNGAFTVKELVPPRDISAPKGATHVGLQGMRAVIDVEKDGYVIAVSQPVVMALGDAVMRDVELKVTELGGGGFEIGVVGVVFFQEINGEMVDLWEGRSVRILVNLTD